jgi:corrinoid protein of di/trimethylamine methyltransferase
MSQELFDAMRKSIVDGDADASAALAAQGLAAGLAPLDSIEMGFVPGLEQVGDSFSCGDMYLPDMMLAARAMTAAVDVLEPAMKASGAQRQIAGRVVIGTIKGDIHEIGKNLVAMMLSAAGFEVHDLGVDVPAERFAEKAREVGADLVGVSALLTTTMTGQRLVVEQLAAAGLRPGVKVMVGGAPVTKGWAEEIGADGYSEDGVAAVALAKRLVAAGG